MTTVSIEHSVTHSTELVGLCGLELHWWRWLCSLCGGCGSWYHDHALVERMKRAHEIVHADAGIHERR